MTDPMTHRPAEQLDEFLSLVGQTAWKPDADLQAIAEWLPRELGAEVAIVNGAMKTVELSTSGFSERVLEHLEPMLMRLATGRVASAAMDVGTAQVRLEAVGSELPRRVLVLVGSAPLTRRAAALASHTGGILAALHRARETDRMTRGYQQKAHQLRMAVLMALQAGDPLLARRMTTGAVPELLDCDRLRVHILRCEKDERERIAQAYQDPSGYHGDGLMVRCPVYDEHLVCLIADRDGSGAEAADGLAAVLRDLVADNPHYALGISSAHPLPATAEAYGQARHALAVASNTPGRVAGYHGQEPLERLLPRAEAIEWAGSVLGPLTALPELTTEITRLAMHFHRSGVARMLNVSRNTVTAHLGRAQSALGLDLRDVRCRATLALALGVAALHREVGSIPAQPDPPALEELLHTRPAAEWGRTFLEPLRDARYHPVHQTLRTWIEANADAQQTARRLGCSRTTVAAHLRTAERRLTRDLLSTGSGVHDLVHALHLSGETPL
ncbi:helix-turn-helix domain-containing protein [Streptomyces atratus]|uniref:PucR C-terminal helix-turn-helix domain-containing protein n=1 Tax=Streptomyces atratus TaxID=1893 RepID=A0A1K1UMZ2_STRAR|nr:helix-turn-helix domain-containing protein [Streptomyces atratus]SFX14194.1 PucR C-terminal helix-turn-helix domain-containing protein [Streptomyces atratus]